MSAEKKAEQSPIDYLKTVDTPTLSNAIELLKVRPQSEGFTPISVRCLFPELGRMVGYAVTAQVESVNKGSIDWNVFLELYAAVANSSKPAVVVLQEVGPHPDFAVHAGEVMTTIFNRLGAVGLVSDCGVRDIPEVRAMKFHYFARGVAASHAYSRIVRVGVPVQVAGMVVRPGDILHGDENGLLSVPAEGIEKLPEMVNQIQSRERGLMEFVRGADFTFEKLKGRILE